MPLVNSAAVSRSDPVSVPTANGAGHARAEDLVESYRRLADVFHHVLSEQSLDALLDRVADTLAELVPYDALHIYEAHEARRVLIPVLARSEWADQIMSSHPEFGQGITGWAVEHRKPVLTNAAHLDPRVRNVPGTPVEPEALITVPLIARGSLKGALNIYRLGEEATFVEHEFELAKWFGDAAALALDNAQIRARLEHQAQTDSLTGLYNHRYFHERLRSELTRASRVQESVAVLMLDIDDFKKVNDIYGHGSGDQLLASLARLIKDTIRASDIVCRIGGEEFGVIMTSCDAGDALGLASRITGRLHAEEFDPAGRITVSIGISQGPEHAMNPRELVACAEAAMMTAKARGKDKTVLFDEDTSERPTSSSRGVRSIAHMKMLQSLAGKLNRLNDVREIGSVIASELRMLIDYHSCRVYVADGQDLLPIAYRGDLDARSEALATKFGEGITGRVAQTGRSLLVPDARNCEFAIVLPGTQEVDESIAAVALRYGSRVIGVILISKLGLDQFDEDDVRLLEVLAGHASVALENARLYESQRREAENAKALLDFTDRMSQAPSVDAVAEVTIATASRLLDASQTRLWLDVDGSGFDCVASKGGGDTATRTRAEAEKLVAGRRTAFVVDGEATVAIAPIHGEDGLRGWIEISPEGGDPHHLTDERLRLLAGISYQAGIALEKARLYRKQQEEAELASALLEFSRELVAAEGLDDVLARIVELSARTLGCPQASVWLQDASSLDLRMRHEWGHERARAEAMREARYGADLAAEWLSRGVPFRLTPDDLKGIADVPGEFLVAPLEVEGERLGCLVVGIGETGFDEGMLRLLSGIAHQAKLAIESADNFESLERTFITTVEALANALEANDEYTSTHARWIKDMAIEVGRELGLDGRTLKRLEYGALFHDIGKIGIPSEILQKPGPLTAEERRVIEEHPALGERILAPIDRLADVRPIVRACHERYDGTGYPDRKAAAEIPVESRIILVCDAFHAMTTDRPYRGRLSAEEACRRLTEAAGTQFDPQVVDAFMELHRSKRLVPLT